MVSNSISAISSSMSASNSLPIKLVCSKPAIDSSLYRTSFCFHFTFPTPFADQAKVPGKQRKREKEITPRATDFMEYPDFITVLVIYQGLRKYFRVVRGKFLHRIDKILILFPFSSPAGRL